MKRDEAERRRKREWYRKKYHSDEDFRQAQIERAKEWHAENRDAAIERMRKYYRNRLSADLERRIEARRREMFGK